MYKTFLLIAVLSACTNGFGQATATSNNTTNIYPRIVARVRRTGQTAPIPTTTLLTPKNDGLYRISAYGVVTVQLGSGAPYWDVLVNWSDEAGQEVCSNSQPCQLMNMNAGSGPPYGVEGGIGAWAPNIATVVRAKAGTPLTYSVVANGNPQGSKYDLFITVERLE